MKKLLILSLVCAAFASCSKDDSPPSDIFSVIEDPVFKEYCQQFDINGDSILSREETVAITKIDVGNYTGDQKIIQSLAGIELFLNLTDLYCSGNDLSELDISKNTKLTKLFCNYNNLSKLDVSKNVALIGLGCSDNNLSELNVGNNKALTSLNCSWNDLSGLDISKNTDLITLDVTFNNFSADTLRAIFTSLPIRIPADHAYIHCLNGNPDWVWLTDADKNICLSKHWNIY